MTYLRFQTRELVIEQFLCRNKIGILINSKTANMESVRRLIVCKQSTLLGLINQLNCKRIYLHLTITEERRYGWLENLPDKTICLVLYMVCNRKFLLDDLGIYEAKIILLQLSIFPQYYHYGDIKSTARWKDVKEEVRSADHGIKNV